MCEFIVWRTHGEWVGVLMTFPCDWRKTRRTSKGEEEGSITWRRLENFSLERLRRSGTSVCKGQHLVVRHIQEMAISVLFKDKQQTGCDLCVSRKMAYLFLHSLTRRRPSPKPIGVFPVAEKPSDTHYLCERETLDNALRPWLLVVGQELATIMLLLFVAKSSPNKSNILLNVLSWIFQHDCLLSS